MHNTGLNQAPERPRPFPSLLSSLSTRNFGERFVIHPTQAADSYRSETQCLILAPTRELALQIQKVDDCMAVEVQ